MPPNDIYGLSEPLSSPEDAVVNVIFVHGLGGGRESSWTSEYNKFWPKTLLPTDLPKARIFSWGYDSKIIHFWGGPSQSRLSDHSSKLLDDLANMRLASDSPELPIILVAHSMGGLVCANALVLAEISPEEYLNSTGNAIGGMMFLGTPHQGSSKAKWADQARKFVQLFKNTSKELLGNLEENSAKLSDLSVQFPKCLRKRSEASKGGKPNSKIYVRCYFEEYETTHVGVIVTTQSAALAGYECTGINADHSKMCKFSSASEGGYVSVSSTLKRWVELLTSPQESSGNNGVNVTQQGVTFGDNNGGLMVGQANSFGSSPVFGGRGPIFGTQNFGLGGQGSNR
ncbi:hypothetical protein VTL71DRAFT_13074 [Oculimacula yallundae]|uniref:GPI inositol-deacylase n=1 Tax=Oculimacula yallundae TaxID=86028 RepID=A0ABR4CRY8_9HELO